MVFKGTVQGFCLLTRCCVLPLALGNFHVFRVSGLRVLGFRVWFFPHIGLIQPVCTFTREKL